LAIKGRHHGQGKGLSLETNSNIVGQTLFIVERFNRGFWACLSFIDPLLLFRELKFAMTTSFWPTEIKLSTDKAILTVTFDNGRQFDLSAEYLRVESPSAEVQGHSPAEKKTIGGKQNVRVLALETVGNYAIRPKFDDGHDTGIFTWAYLFELGATHGSRWDDYLNRLQQSAQRRFP